MRWSRVESDFASPLCDSLLPNPKPESIYNADGGLSAKFDFSADLKLLSCDGFILDEIIGLGATEEGYFDWDTKTIVQCPEWKSMYGDHNNTANALSKAIIGGRISKGRHSQDHHKALLTLPSTFRAAHRQFRYRNWDWLAGQEAYYFKWERWRKAHNNLMIGPTNLGDYFSNVIPEDAKETDYMEVFSAVSRMVMERRFMLTTKGYFGWAPDNAYDSDKSNQTRTGDLIAVIYGCSTPLIIRTCKDNHQIIGEAYVEGFMDGEAIGRGQECYETQTFTFC